VYDQGDDEFWNIKTVMARTGLCRTSIYDYMARGMFPRWRRLGLRKVGWLASEVRLDRHPAIVMRIKRCCGSNGRSATRGAGPHIRGIRSPRRAC
jgi:prophage regulatory protein